MGVRLFSPRAEAGQEANGIVGWGRQREALALVLLTLALGLGLALFSLELEPNGAISRGGNWVGPVGAWFARLLVASFGFTAWLVPAELALMLVSLTRASHPAQPFGLRVASDIVVAVIVASLTQVAVPALEYGEGLRAGGSVGLFLGEVSRSLFSTAGSFLVGTTAIGLILIARSGFSLLQWWQRAASVARFAWLAAGEAWLRLARAWRAAAALRREAAAQRRAALGRQRVGMAPALTAGAPSPERQDGRGSWLPNEVTGVPPAAVSKSLRANLTRAVNAVLDEHEQADESAESETEAEAASTRSRRGGTGKKKRRRRARASEPPAAPVEALEEVSEEEAEVDAEEPGVEEEEEEELYEVRPAPGPRPVRLGPEALGPKIVDTRPHSEILRAERAGEGEEERGGDYTMPSPELLQPTPDDAPPVDKERVLQLAAKLESTLADYGVVGTVEEIHPGPTVTTYEVAPQAGTKVSKVAKLADDLALGLERKVRIIAPIPGKGRIGFEIPNDQRIPVNLRELIEDQRFEKLSGRALLPVVIGRDIVGAPFYADLAEMPHVIVAGATGSGKSVGLNVMLCSLLFCRTPNELRLLMVDPKVVELAPFDGIPHMLLPVVTDMKQAATALKWAVDEMERRYKAFAIAGTKNIGTYNRWVDKVGEGKAPLPDEADLQTLSETAAASLQSPAGEGNLPARLPYIVIVVDEFADLMMQQGKEVEASVARLAQKARAAGMHVLLATQRPSVDVITGMIKANFPTRVAFRVAQKVDSRTILDEQGAEFLLGKGDMLAKLNGSGDTRRVQCPFISEEEVSDITDHLRAQGTPEYHDDILKAGDDDDDESSVLDEPLDPRFDEAVRIVGETQRCSTSWIQRKLGIGYNRAAKIVEMMELQGMVGPPNGSKEREIFIHGH